VRASRVSLKSGQPDAVCVVVKDEKGDLLRVEDLSSGKPVLIAAANNLPSGSEYVFGKFRGSALVDFIFYKAGENTVTVRPLEETTAGQFQFGKPSSFDLGQPVRRIVALNGTPDR